MRYLVVLMLCAVAAFAYAQTGKPNQSTVAPYQLYITSAGNAAFLLNTQTGAVAHCVPTGGTDPTGVKCVGAK